MYKLIVCASGCRGKLEKLGAVSKHNLAHSKWVLVEPGMKSATAYRELMLNWGEGRDSGSRRKLGVPVRGYRRWMNQRTEINNPDATMLTRPFLRRKWN